MPSLTLRQFGWPLATALLLTLVACPAIAAPTQMQNVLASVRTGDLAGQIEDSPAIAAFQRKVVCVFNEPNSGGSPRLHCTVSCDSGATFTEISMPSLPAGYSWRHEPQLAVDERSGEIFLCGHVAISGPPSLVGVAVASGSFESCTFTWSAGSLAYSTTANFFAVGTLAFAVDSATHSQHILFVDKVTNGEHGLRYLRRLNGSPTWTSTFLNATEDSNAVSRPMLAVGLKNRLDAAWLVQDTPAIARLLYRQSTTNGSAFFPPVLVDSVYSPSFMLTGSGYAVFDGPTLAVGRVGKTVGLPMLAWTECYDARRAILPDTLAGPAASEVEPNDTPGAAMPIPVGTVLRGTFQSSADPDLWRLSLTHGQNVVFVADSLTAGLFYNISILAADGVTTVAFGRMSLAGTQFLWTAPSQGLYFIKIVPNSGALAIGKGYRLRVGSGVTTPGHARDESDLRYAYGNSTGTSWTRATLGVTPSGTAERFAHIAFDRFGKASLTWYGFHQDSLGVKARLSLIPDLFNFSSASVTTLVDVASDWSKLPSSATTHCLQTALSLDGPWLRYAWMDLRSGDPDVYTAGLVSRLAFTTHARSDSTGPGRTVSLALPVQNFSIAVSESVNTTVSSTRQWSALDAPTGWIGANSTQPLTFELTVPDSATSGEQTFTIILRSSEDAEADTMTVTLIIDPARAGVAPGAGHALALSAPWPDPARASASMTFTLPRAGAAQLEIFGIAGERVRVLASGTREAGAFTQRWDLRDDAGRRVAPGLYLARLQTAEGTRTRRLVVLR
jgi:hypothetical protein